MKNILNKTEDEFESVVCNLLTKLESDGLLMKNLKQQWLESQLVLLKSACVRKSSLECSVTCESMETYNGWMDQEIVKSHGTKIFAKKTKQCEYEIGEEVGRFKNNSKDLNWHIVSSENLEATKSKLQPARRVWESRTHEEEVRNTKCQETWPSPARIPPSVQHNRRKVYGRCLSFLFFFLFLPLINNFIIHWSIEISMYVSMRAWHIIFIFK